VIVAIVNLAQIFKLHRRPLPWQDDKMTR
jgi:hypothetical protein